MKTKNFETLEVGKWYKQREGGFVAIEKTVGDPDYPFLGNNGVLYTKGGFIRECRDKSPYDLVEKVDILYGDPIWEIWKRLHKLDASLEFSRYLSILKLPNETIALEGSSSQEVINKLDELIEKRKSKPVYRLGDKVKYNGDEYVFHRYEGDKCYIINEKECIKVWAAELTKKD